MDAASPTGDTDRFNCYVLPDFTAKVRAMHVRRAHLKHVVQP
jgi:hypothetical protein